MNIFLSDKRIGGVKRYSRPAFTLLEMTVSLSIIVIVTAFFITNFRTANKRTDLVMAAQTMVSDLHAAQNNTLGLAKYNDISPAGGWGIHFERGKSTYTMFADLDSPGHLGYMEMDSDEDETDYGARTMTLSEGLEISSIRFGSSLTSTDSIDITFLPPDPQTNIRSASGATSTSVQIELKEQRSGATKLIKVNFLGLVESVSTSSPAT